MRGKILAVDDQPDQLAMVKELLHEEGFTVETAPNGFAALKQLAHNRPELILVDISMPDMNGFTFCETLRKNPATASIPIIMLTGLRSQFNQVNALACGVDAYIAKPFMADELLGKVTELLQRKSAAPS